MPSNFQFCLTPVHFLIFYSSTSNETFKEASLQLFFTNQLLQHPISNEVKKFASALFLGYLYGDFISKFSLTSVGFSFCPTPPCFFLLFLKLCRKERKRVNGAFCISDGNLRFLNGGKISGGRIEKEFLHFLPENLEVTFCPVLSSSFNQFLLFRFIEELFEL